MWTYMYLTNTECWVYGGVAFLAFMGSLYYLRLRTPPRCGLCNDSGYVRPVSCNDPFAGPCSCKK